MFHCFYSLPALAKRETIEIRSFAYSTSTKKERGRCREQGIRKVEKCLQTRLSTRAEHRRPMWGEITFTLTYLLQLRLCFENFLINLESILSPGLFLLRNQRNILVCKKCSFPTGTNRGFWAEHLLCKNVQPWLRVLFARTS